MKLPYCLQRGNQLPYYLQRLNQWLTTSQYDKGKWIWTYGGCLMSKLWLILDCEFNNVYTFNTICCDGIRYLFQLIPFRNRLAGLLISGHSPNNFFWLSQNGRNFLFLLFLVDKTVFVWPFKGREDYIAKYYAFPTWKLWDGYSFFWCNLITRYIIQTPAYV